MAGFAWHDGVDEIFQHARFCAHWLLVRFHYERFSAGMNLPWSALVYGRDTRLGSRERIRLSGLLEVCNAVGEDFRSETALLVDSYINGGRGIVFCIGTRNGV